VHEDRPLQLTYFITGLQYGGANVGMARLLSELSGDEFDVTVVALVETPHDVVDLLPDHVQVIVLDMSSWSDLGRLSRIVPIVRRTDVLVCSLFHATAVGMALGTLFRVPTTLVWQHSTQHRSVARKYGYRAFYKFADCILADSDAVIEMISEAHPISGNKIRKVPIAGINTEQFSPGSHTSDLQEITIGTVGRVVELKGYAELIDVAEILDDKYQFRIAGDGPDRKQFEKIAPENVRFYGRVDSENIPSFLSSCDIYFQPSHHEGLCMTVIEAMACELPVVASGVGGITESVVPGETGFLCPPEDVDCFRRRLRELGDDPDLRTRMGKRGRDRVIERYSAEALANAFRDVIEYRNVIQN